MHLTDTERITVLMMRGYGDRIRSYREVADLFNATYPDRDPIANTTVKRTVDRFQRTGLIKDAPRSGRPKNANNVEKALDVLLTVTDNPHTSVSRAAQANDISATSVRRILKKHHYHPYKIHLVQELSEDDYDRRVEFCDTMMTRLADNHQFFNWICFSDEATFELNGSVNRQNMRYWADENPHWMRDSHTQYPQKVNVWAGIILNRIIGPFFIEGNINSQNYCNLLRNQVIPAIEDIVGDAFHNVWFQQDGAPAHFSLEARNILNNVFTDRWIGRRGTIEWPPRSPDLNPLDFFYWGYLKTKVYETRFENLEELREKIVNVSNSITPDFLTNVIDTFYVRLGYCQVVEGHQFEHLIQ